MNFARQTYRMKNMKHVHELYQNRRSLWEMFSDVFRGKYKMSFMTSFIVFLGIFYIIMPLDFDWIPLLGWIDDGFVAYWVFKRLLKENERYNLLKNKTAYKMQRNETIEEAEIIDES